MCMPEIRQIPMAKRDLAQPVTPLHQHSTLQTSTKASNGDLTIAVCLFPDPADESKLFADCAYSAQRACDCCGHPASELRSSPPEPSTTTLQSLDTPAGTKQEPWMYSKTVAAGRTKFWTLPRGPLLPG